MSSEGDAAADRWDAGENGCGSLAIGLHARIARLDAGAILEVVARDPSARSDLPAWCRLTGHALVSADHPIYRIRRKDG
jgi:tRNA 2-thiouridine synthesizing protein A